MQQATKQKAVVRDAKSGRTIEWVAATKLSDSGSVTIAAGDALKAKVVQSQLDAVRRIREKLLPK